MATFNITADTNIDACTSKGGADIYNINGFTLTIDQDSRYGLNNTTSASIDRIVISATLGGTCLIDARAVRLIPFNTGSGTITIGNTITCGSGSGKVIGIYTSLTTAPTNTGASGWIKVKQSSGTWPTSGSYTQAGFTFTITGADIAGWIEILTEEGATAQPALAATVPRLGSFQMRGEWYELGMTSGAANQTVQVPTNGSNTYIPGVFIAQTAGAGQTDFEFYPNVGSATAIATDIRAKVCWINSTGLVRIGHNGTGNAGYVPTSNRRIVVPNIITSHCTSAAKTANVTPNATNTSRWEMGLTTGSGGSYVIDKANLAWWPNFNQCFSVAITNTGVFEQINVSELASYATWNNVGVGQSAAVVLTGLVLASSRAGGAFTNCVWSRATLAAAGGIVTLTDVVGFSFPSNSAICCAVKSNAGGATWVATRAFDCSWTSNVLVGGKVQLVTCKNVTWTGTKFVDVVNGSTASTSGQNNSVWEISTACDNVKLDGLDFLSIANVHPYLAVLTVNAAQCANVKLRNIGSYASPLSVGSSNQTAYLLSCASSSLASDVLVQRCYLANTRSGLWATDNSIRDITFENCGGDYADAPVAPMLNAVMRGNKCTQAVTAQTACYGTHFFDCYTSTTAGRIGILANETTADTSAQVALLNGAAFTSTGNVYLPVIGHEVTFTQPGYVIGHTGFSIAEAVMGGGTIANHNIFYQIDLNNGAGFGSWHNVYYRRTATGGANGELTFTVADATGIEIGDYVWGTSIGASARVTQIVGTTITVNVANTGTVSGTLRFNHLPFETTINAANGFKLKVRIVTVTTNTAAISSLYFISTSTTTTQAYTYPLDLVPLTLTGLQNPTEVRVFNAGTTTEVPNSGQENVTTGTFTAQIDSAAYPSVDVSVISLGYQNTRLLAQSLGTGLTIPVQQQLDRQYLNP